MRDYASSMAMREALSNWVSNIRGNRFYRPKSPSRFEDVWCFKWNESNLVYEAGYGSEFENHPGIYMFLRDEGVIKSYEPLYIGSAGGQSGKPTTPSLSDRIFKRYIPHTLNYHYKPPLQMQILAWHGKLIRDNDPAWAAQKEKLIQLGTSNIRLRDAEFFAKNTLQGPYFTFYPMARKRDEDVQHHKVRIRNVEQALIHAADDLGFKTCNEQKPAPDWNLVRES